MCLSSVSGRIRFSTPDSEHLCWTELMNIISKGTYISYMLIYTYDCLGIYKIAVAIVHI